MRRIYSRERDGLLRKLPTYLLRRLCNAYVTVVASVCVYDGERVCVQVG